MQDKDLNLCELSGSTHLVQSATFFNERQIISQTSAQTRPADIVPFAIIFYNCDVQAENCTEYDGENIKQQRHFH